MKLTDRDGEWEAIATLPKSGSYAMLDMVRHVAYSMDERLRRGEVMSSAQVENAYRAIGCDVSWYQDSGQQTTSGVQMQFASQPQSQPTVTDKVSIEGMPDPVPGRYALYTVPHGGSHDLYRIDTVTGKVWRWESIRWREMGEMPEERPH